MQLQVNISLGVSNIITLLVGALIVWLLWQYDHQRRTKATNYLRRTICNLVYDKRKNSLVENIISGIERGRAPALKDFHLLDGVVRAAFVVSNASSGLRQFWQKGYRERASAAWMDEDEEEVR